MMKESVSLTKNLMKARIGMQELKKLITELDDDKTKKLIKKLEGHVYIKTKEVQEFLIIIQTIKETILAYETAINETLAVEEELLNPENEKYYQMTREIKQSNYFQTTQVVYALIKEGKTQPEIEKILGIKIPKQIMQYDDTPIQIVRTQDEGGIGKEDLPPIPDEVYKKLSKSRQQRQIWQIINSEQYKGTMLRLKDLNKITKINLPNLSRVLNKLRMKKVPMPREYY